MTEFLPFKNLLLKVKEYQLILILDPVNKNKLIIVF